MADEEVNQTEEAPMDPEELEAKADEVLEDEDPHAKGLETAPDEELELPSDMPDVGIDDESGTVLKVLEGDDQRLEQDEGTPVEVESVR